MPTNPKSRSPFTRPDRIVATIAIIAVLNFLAYAITASILGGDAINGKHENDRYYFYNKKQHAHFEVSPAIFHYSRIHTYSVWGTHAAAAIAVVTLLLSRRGQPIAPI